MSWLGREFSNLGFCDDSVEPLGCRTENLFSMRVQNDTVVNSQCIALIGRMIHG